MSIDARLKLTNSTNAYFQNNSQKLDFLDIHAVKTETVALALELIGKGNIIEFTAVKSDHHDDSCLGPFCHFGGAAFDCWALTSHRAGTYADANSPQMKKLIHDIMASRWTVQCGLAGAAQCQDLIAAAGFITYPYNGRLFPDDGADHIHVGAHYPQGVFL